MPQRQRAPAKGLVARPPPEAALPRDYVPLAESHHALYQIATEAFVGPLDLLLFLIRRHQLDIFDIPMAFVCARYLDVMTQARQKDIDVAAEFLAMASELVHIKSRMLLPKEQTADDEPLEGDPRAELVARLLMLQSFQEAATALDGRPQLGRDIFSATPEPADAVPRPLRLLEPMALTATFDALLRRREAPVAHRVVVEQVPMRQRMGRLLERLDERGSPLPWATAFDEVEGRLDLIVMFLAVLELAKQHLLQIAEDEDGNIVLLSQFASLGDARSRLAGVDLEAAFA